MKTLPFVLAFLLMIGCATVPTSAPPPQKVLIEVSSVTDSEVTVNENVNRVHQSMEVRNPSGGLSMLTFICEKNKKAYVKIFSGLSISDVTNFWNDMIWLENNTNITEVGIFLNSPGGDAFQGLALADEIERAQNRGFKIIAHASGIIASAAVPVLAVCDKRVAAAGTIFMVHEAALWKWPGRESASDIRSQNELMGMLRDRYIKKLTDNTNISESKLTLTISSSMKGEGES